MIPYIRKIARDWVELYSQPQVDDGAEDPLPIYEALIDGSAPFAWVLILETILQDSEGKSLHMLIAGPLQSFIARWGDAWIDAIEAEAASNLRLKWALGAITKSRCPDNLWERLSAIKGPEWLPFSDNPPPYPIAN
ncbi:MAG: DUF6869 domain-containing protein [Sphingorhabdus sp.]